MARNVLLLIACRRRLIGALEDHAKRDERALAEPAVVIELVPAG
jgi:hypothetical protein